MKNNITPLKIIENAKNQGIVLCVHNGKLAIKKDKNIKLSKEFLKVIQKNKKELLLFFKEVNFYEEKIKKVELSNRYEISNAQRRILFLCQLKERSITYNVPNHFVLEQIYDVKNFKRAINEVIERHEILRTIFTIDEKGNGWQYILRADELNFSLYEKDYTKEKEALKKANEYIQLDSVKPFNLKKGPLLRASLLKIDENKYIFYYNLHHIITDGWSMEVLAKDVKAYYQAFSYGTKVKLLPLEIQYKDYTIWQKNQLESKKFKVHKDYWVSKLEKKIRRIKLPFQKEERIPSFEGKSIQVFISEEETQKLRNFTIESRESLFLGVFTVWNILLYQYTGEEEITLGNPVVGRNHTDLQNQIGFYVNTLALRNTIKSEESFKTIFQKVAIATREAYSHQMYPFDKVMEDLKELNGTENIDLFNILIDYHGVSYSTMNMENNEITEFGNTLIKFNVEIHVKEINKGISITLNYNKQLYDDIVMKQLLTNYKTLFNKVLLNKDKEIGLVNLLTESELIKLQNEAIGEIINFSNNETVLTQFEEQVLKTPTEIALRYNEETLTYLELHEKSSQLANCLLQEYGIKKGDCIGIYLNREINYIIAIWGILKAGAIYIPIDVNYPLSRKNYIVTDSKLQLLISDTNHVFDFDFFEGTVFALDVEFEAKKYDTTVNINITSKDAAYIIYTSGSTGSPKGVLISHLALNNYANFGKENYLKPSLRNYDFGWFTSPSFDLTITSLFLSIIKGGTIHIFSETLHTIKILESYLRQGISCIKLTPSHINLLKGFELEETTLEMVVVGGEALKKVQVDILLKLNPKITIYNEYGPTEATVGCMISEINSTNADKIITIGKPIQNVEIYILNKKQKLVSEGVLGELYIGGQGLALGYFNRPELTAEKFIQSPFIKGEHLYKTGDMATKLFDGNILYKGRNDEQVKINGYRIELQEIENALNSIKNIQQEAVLARENKEGDLQLVAYIKSNNQFSEKETQEELLKSLPEYMIPKIYINLEEMPLTQNGKIDKKALKNIDFLVNISKEYEEPETEIEKVLAKAWETVLKKDKVGKKDNFSLLGGDSIKLMHLIVHLKGEGYILGVLDSIQFPIMEDMAKVVFKERIKQNEDILNSENEIFEEPSVNIDVISENQRYFLQRPWDMITSQIIVLENYEKEVFEMEFKEIIKEHNSLAICFSKENDIIHQHDISIDELNIEFKHIWLNENLNNVYDQSHNFLKRKFNYFDDSACIRVFIATDIQEPDKAYARISIAHALIDIYSFEDICKAIQKTIKRKVIKLESNQTFGIWQQQFLKTDAAIQQRNWWKKQLSKSTIVEIQQSKSEVKLDYTVLQKTITGFEYKELKEIAKRFNMPLNAILMAAHHHLLNELKFSDSNLILTAVNGREDSYKGFDKKNFSGVLTNYLPLKSIEFKHTSFEKHIIEIYEQYIQARFYQKIPYETIRKDFLNHAEIDIENGVKGFFNFINKDSIDISIENLKSNEITIRKDKLFWNIVYGVGLICVVYKNGIELRLITPTELYEDDVYNEQFHNFLEPNFFNQFEKMI